VNLSDVTSLAEKWTPDEIVAWSIEQFPGAITVACSFEDLVLLDIVRRHAPRTPVIFLDTEGHFPETYEFVNRIEKDWDLNLVRTVPGADAADKPCGTDGCCQVRKVGPLQRAVAGYGAWLTSVKRVDAVTRADMPVISWDEKFGLVKVNPLATWTDDDVLWYIGEHQLPEHPLWAEGYTSIGCAAVTAKPAPGADRRSGRWAGSDHVECGLHEA